MTKREYLKYNNPTAYDKLGKHVKPGDTVIINSNYYSVPFIGKVSHYTQTGKLAIQYGLKYGSSTTKCWAYRDSNKVIKFKNGRKNNS